MDSVKIWVVNPIKVKVKEDIFKIKRILDKEDKIRYTYRLKTLDKKKK